MRKIAFLTCLVLVAGCSGKPSQALAADNAPNPDAAFPERLEWGLTECQFFGGVTAVPKDAIAPYLPAGFRSLSLTEVPGLGVPAAGDTANFGVEMFACKSGVGLNGPVVDMSYGSYFSWVEPPAALKNKSLAYHFVKWDVLIPDPDRRELLREAGVPALDGSAQFIRFSRQGSALQADASMVMGNKGDPHFLDGALAVPFDVPNGFEEFTKTDAGFVVWTTMFKNPVASIGPAMLEVPNGSLAYKILKTADPIPVLGFGGTVSFESAEIRIPGRAKAPDEPTHTHAPVPN